ncbi:GNAT family N-acetyltransferase [Guptibacillus algicola]|uniref:GNAT family N-acetyltransferase n=1 Tax=Guptibacillus algicola TaxID=225844 RepID=UPI001CD76399|nr:GNAT family N-acetyltransferase [Alkalihalobacillus algicola]MCA0988467.1 GNAT family N-acetyltransferase [Alkalihalobacillus algicola]
MIKEMKSTEELKEAFLVMSELRPQLVEETYLTYVNEAREIGSYHLYALYEEGEIVAVIGFSPMITLYYGRSVWVYDLVTRKEDRSKGYGKALLSFVEQWAADHDYTSVALSSGMQRLDSHRFYEEKMAYDKVSYVFKKEL